MTVSSQQAAIRADAKKRIAALRPVARRLWPAMDDALVMSELVSVIGALRQAEAALKQAETELASR